MIALNGAGVAALIAADPWRMEVLAAVHGLGLPDWAIGAGFVRNAVWDRLYDIDLPTPLNDIDVLFFDRRRKSVGYERTIEADLGAVLAGVPWSARNQARMHVRNGDRPYRDTEDAITHWLETPTTVAVRLEDGKVVLIAPYGIDDLIGGIVRPTPHGRRRLEQYQDRMRSKDWAGMWPGLTILGC